MFTVRYYMWQDATLGKVSSNIGSAVILECASAPTPCGKWLCIETPKGCVMLDFELVAMVEYAKSE